MAEFIYNTAINASTNNMHFELNYGYYSYISFEDKIDLYSRFCSVNKLIKKLKDLILIFYQNLFYI